MSEPETPARPAGRIVVRKKRDAQKWTEKRRQIFLAHLAQTANVTRSAEEAGMSLSAAYLLKNRDRAFERAWREALDIGFCELEMALLRDAIHGRERIETVVVGEERQLKYEKRVVECNPASSVRLLQLHKVEVHAFREERDSGDQETDEDRLQADMDRVRERLLAEENVDLGMPGDD